jgi:hypothetical protein
LHHAENGKILHQLAVAEQKEQNREEGAEEQAVLAVQAS